MRDKDELDQMIDAALTSYGTAAAGDPIEERLLRAVQRRLAEEHVPPRHRWLPWAATLAAAACIAAFFIAHPNPMRIRGIDSHQPSQQDRGSSTAESKPPAQEIQPRTSTELRSKSRAKLQSARQPAQTASLPKLDVFPTPRSPTEDEAALALFIQRAPESEVRALFEAQARADAPVIINELEIPPIEPLNEGGR